MQNLTAFWRRRAPLDAQAQQQARIDAKLRAIERQGAGSVMFAHGLAYLLVIAFSAGSLIALAGDALNHFIAQARGGVLDVPSLISFIVSFALVFAMDTSMVIAAANVRMHKQRHQPGAAIHVAMIVGVCAVESATYLYMSYVYDHPAGWVAWTILTARAVAAPIVAVYLSLSRTLPISARDINTQVEAVTGRGVLVDMTRIADDADATTERKVALYRAAAIMDDVDASRLDAIIQAERSTRTAGTAGDAPPLPSTTPAPARPTRQSPHDARRAAFAEQMYTDLDEYEPLTSGAPADDFAAWGDDGPDSTLFTRQPHVTSPRAKSNGHASRNGSSAATIGTRTVERIIRDDPLQYLPASRYERDTDSDERRRVFRVLDEDSSITRAELMRRADVSDGTARLARTLWNERRSKLGRRKVAPRTGEMPAITAEMLESSPR